MPGMRRWRRSKQFSEKAGILQSGVMIEFLEHSMETIAFARSLAGHIGAGVASEEEIRAFWKFCESLG